MMQTMGDAPENLTLMQIMERFGTDEKARAYLESVRWPNGPVCPHCGNADRARIYDLTANPGKRVRAGLRQCVECSEQFTVTVGTIFEASHVPLRKWLIAWYLLCSSKKGFSALQLQRTLEIGSYRTAWFMFHRIRYAMKDPVFTDKLKGTVEADETWIGGKRKHVGHGYTGNKVSVLTIVERDGRARSQVMDDVVSSKNIDAVLGRHVELDATLNTDEAGYYNKPGRKFKKHNRVNHRAGEYVRGDATTNTVEGYFANLKRGIIGVYHHVGRKYLPQYLGEFDFRYNERKVTDGERTLAGLRKVEGKRLMLRRPKGTPTAPVPETTPPQPQPVPCSDARPCGVCSACQVFGTPKAA